MKKIKMESQNKYLGDDKFKKFLEHYSCPTPLEIIKLRFAGSICSPNLELRPTDVISSFWEPGKSPRLETKDEADLFFKFFMGLWDEMFQQVKANKVHLSPAGNLLFRSFHPKKASPSSVPCALPRLNRVLSKVSGAEKKTSNCLLTWLS